MRSRSLLCAGVVGSLLAAAGCSDEGGFVPEEHFGVSESWIINGQLDTTRQAVVALFGQQSGCTGTIIHVAGNSAYILTAAHCFGFGPLQQVAIGNDYYQATAVLNVVDYQIHPQYDPQNIVYDFAILRATPASAATPVIPALTPSDDSLAPGTAVTHVGYGLTSYPNGSTSKRHQAAGSLAQVAQSQIAYQQPVSGPCSGDSGGPNLVQTPNGERVAGVISYGDQQCNQFGVSGRASAVYANFIVPFMGVDPSSSSSAVTSTVASSSASGVGGGETTTTSAGQGGGWVDDGDAGWVAGTPAEDYEGEVLTSSGCAASGRAPGAEWLLLLGLGLAFRRRA